jgi:hypothetical protein
MRKLLFLSLILLILVTTTGCGILNHQMTGNDVIKAFKQDGLQAENVHPMTTEEYGEAPRVCNGTRFLIPSLGPDNGGRVFICDKQDEQNQIVSYYEGLNRTSSLYFSWVFIKGNIVVQINGDLDGNTAEKYDQAIP